MTALAATRVGAQRTERDTGYRRHDWRDDAACAGMDVETFYPPGTGWLSVTAYEEARRICNTCPVKAQCLAAGQTERHGMWGGTTPDERGYDSSNGKKKRKR